MACLFAQQLMYDSSRGGIKWKEFVTCCDDTEKDIGGFAQVVNIIYKKMTIIG
jgi:hypothetical protein